ALPIASQPLVVADGIAVARGIAVVDAVAAGAEIALVGIFVEAHPVPFGAGGLERDQGILDQLGMVLEIDADALPQRAVVVAAGRLQEAAAAVAPPVPLLGIAELAGLARISQAIDALGDLRLLVGQLRRLLGRNPRGAPEYLQQSAGGI